MRLTKSFFRMYAPVFSIPLAIGVGVAAAVLPVLIGNPGGLEVKITAAEKLCVDRPAEVRIELINGGEETYHGELELRAPDGTRLFKGTATASGREGFYLRDWKPSTAGGYAITAFVQQKSVSSSHQQLRSTDGEEMLEVRYCT